MVEAARGKSEVLDRADRAWSSWQEYLARESSSDRADDRGADGWRLAEALAHVARWQVWGVNRIKEVLAGGELSELGELEVDRINAEWMVEDDGIAYAEAERRMEAAWAGLRASIVSVPDERWQPALTQVVAANTWEHYDEHAGWRSGAAQVMNGGGGTG